MSDGTSYTAILSAYTEATRFEHLPDEVVEDRELFALAERVTSSGDTITPFEAFETFWTGSFPEVTVAVELTDGTMLSRTLRYPKGHPRNPFTWADTEALFRRTASVVLPDHQVDRIVDAVRHLEQATDLHHLAALTVQRTKP